MFVGIGLEQFVTTKHYVLSPSLMFLCLVDFPSFAGEHFTYDKVLLA